MGAPPDKISVILANRGDLQILSDGSPALGRANVSYIRPDSPTALAAACLALVARARTDEAMTDQEGRLADALSVIEDKLRDAVKGEKR